MYGNLKTKLKVYNRKKQKELEDISINWDAFQNLTPIQMIGLVNLHL